MHPELAGVTSWAATIVPGVVAVGVELRTKRIPNWLTLGGLVPALGIALFTERAVDALEGFGLAAIATVVLFYLNRLAGGGVKLAALLGLTSGLGGGAAIAVGAVVAYALMEALGRARPESLAQVPSSPFVLALALGGIGVRAALA